MNVRLAALSLALAACESGAEPVDVEPYRDDAAWLRYETTFRYFVEQSEAATDCGAVVYRGQTSGYFGVTPGSDAGVSLLHWEGMGCDIEVRAESGGPFTATAQTCRLPAGADAGRFDVGRFDIDRINFDQFAFDPESQSLTARGRIGRVVDGRRTSFCFALPDEP